MKQRTFSPVFRRAFRGRSLASEHGGHCGFFFQFHQCVFFRLFFERFVDVTVLQILCSGAPLCHAIGWWLSCPSRWQVPLPPRGANVDSVWCSTSRVLCRPGRGRHHLILWDASVKGVFFNVPILLRRSSFLMNVHNALYLQLDDVLVLCFLLGEGRIR